MVRASGLRREDEGAMVAAYPDSGSNIDAEVQLKSAADLLRYLPRAVVVGCLAPFPNMWLGSGARVGSTGRRLAGLESLATYAVEALALVGLWRGRRRLGVCCSGPWRRGG